MRALPALFLFFGLFVVPADKGVAQDPFAVTNRVEDVEDPFAKANELTAVRPPVAPPAPRGFNEPKAATKAAKRPPTADRIDFEVSLTPARVARGEVAKLTITGKPRPGFHTYPLTQRARDQEVTQLSKITFGPSPGLKPLWPVTESAPVLKTIPQIGTELEHEQPFTWTQDILVLPEAKPGVLELPFTVRLQVCDNTCVWGAHEFAPAVEVSDQPAVPLSSEFQARLGAAQPPIQVVDPPGNGGAAAPAGEVADKDRSLAGFMFIAMGAAVAMLFTPCVFPMIPITVSFFLKQSEREHHNPLPTAAVYSLTITVVLAASMLVLGKFIVVWANDPWLNFGLGVVLCYFAFSLFGMYEIELPQGLARFTAGYEGKGGYVGAFFMALTFTITSFTCTGPFLGPLLAAAKELELTVDKLLLGSLAYSATFAAPFFVLALFPKLIKKLPKSGGWLNAVKVVMGFLELGAALKFLANTDLALNPGNPMLFNYDTVLCAWIALSVACALYLFGVFRLPHDSPVESLGVPRMLLGSIFVGLAIYMIPALWRVTPQGVVGSGLVAFLPLDTRAPEEPGRGGSMELTWTRDYEAAYQQAVREGKLLFVDFTGVNCTNCRYNEKNVFTKPGVRKQLEQYVRVQLYTDSVPDPKLSAAESQQQAARNSAWQSATFGDITNPFYAIVKPEKGQPALGPGSDGQPALTGASRALTRKGLIPGDQVEDFERFLSAPLNGSGLRVARAE